MKTPLTLTLAALGLAFAAQPASAAAQCAEDPSKLDSAFLIMTENGQFCEGGSDDQARFEAELEAEQARADAERLAEEKRQLAQYKSELTRHYLQNGMAASDARKAADQAAMAAAQAAGVAEQAAHEAKARAAAPAGSPAAMNGPNGFGKCMAGVKSGTSPCGFAPPDISKAIRPGLMGI
jgi:hypothetical protein